MDEIQRFFMNHALCHTRSRIHKISSFFSNVIGGGGGGGEGRRGLLHSLLFCKIVCHDELKPPSQFALLQFCCSFVLHV